MRENARKRAKHTWKYVEIRENAQKLENARKYAKMREDVLNCAETRDDTRKSMKAR